MIKCSTSYLHSLSFLSCSQHRVSLHLASFASKSQFYYGFVSHMYPLSTAHSSAPWLASMFLHVPVHASLWERQAARCTPNIHRGLSILLVELEFQGCSWDMAMGERMKTASWMGAGMRSTEFNGLLCRVDMPLCRRIRHFYLWVNYFSFLTDPNGGRFRYRSSHNNACMRLMPWDASVEAIFLFSATNDGGGMCDKIS